MQERPASPTLGLMERAALVTGGAQGIGDAIVKALLEAGYAVASVDKDGEALQEQQERLATYRGYLPIEADIAFQEGIEHAVRLTLERFGRLHGLVNNAAVSADAPLHALSRQEWEAVLAVNLTAPCFLAQACAPHLAATRGAIVNICSTRALMSEPHTEAYSASKGGLLALTHALAVSLGPRVRVNAVSPGWIEVRDRKKRALRQEVHHTEEDALQHPAGRVGVPEDIARMVLFLLDPANDFITGQNFVIDGGMTRKMIYV
ncbi:putative short chain dehydrogenase [Spirochaeta thermophila DSM 6192]|uniref:Putative short chain dehydrogenase n=2 Tax=Winmispira thermophila TaxID=154 RepID=E0RP13_WINT6|nr:putative short chain dehydrogenase [Spirochaeta thermophila DSM 6192]